MHNRGGFPIRNVLFGLFVIATLTLLYVYNSSQSRLRESENLAARNRRDLEEKVTEIQDLMKSKDQYQERCENEKHELNNRIKTCNQQHDMLKSQHTELQADNTKLQQDIENMRQEHSQAESQHVQEYQALKQEKDNEISTLSDRVADANRQNEILQNTIANLKNDLENNKQSQQALLSQNAMLQQQQQQQQQQQLGGNNPQQPQQQQNAGQQPLQGNAGFQPQANLGAQQQQLNAGNQQNAGFQQDNLVHHEPVNLKLSQGFGGQGQLVQNMKIGEGFPQNLGGHVDDMQAKQLDETEHKQIVDNLNAQHQVQAPHNQVVETGEEKPHQDNAVARPDANPNDEQKNQILGPNLGGGVDKNADNGDDGDEDRMDVRQIEEDREREAEEEGALSHQDNAPLGLQQMQQPQNFGGFGERADVQQRPPLVPNENENKDTENNAGGEQRQAVNPVAP